MNKTAVPPVLILRGLSPQSNNLEVSRILKQFGTIETIRINPAFCEVQFNTYEASNKVGYIFFFSELKTCKCKRLVCVCVCVITGN